MMNEYNNNESVKSKNINKNQQLINFKYSMINKDNNRGYYDIPRLILNKKEEKKKKDITNIINYPYNLEDILNKNNLSLIKEKKLILNKQKVSEEKDLFNQLSNWNELNNENRQSILNQLFLKELSCELNIDESKKIENIDFIDYSLKNKDEIQKIIVNGVNYKITGNPKKVEIKEEILSDINNLNKKEEKKENEEKSYYHRKIVIKKNLDIKDINSNGKTKNNEEISYIQKIEKDIRAETRIRNINISKDTYKNIGKNLKQIFDNIGVININKSYEIRDNKLFEVNNIFDINNYNSKIQKDCIRKKNHSYEIKKNNINDNIIFYEKDLINENINNINEYNKNNKNDDERNNKNNEKKLNISGNKRKRFHRIINKEVY